MTSECSASFVDFASGAEACAPGSFLCGGAQSPPGPPTPPRSPNKRAHAAAPQEALCNQGWHDSARCPRDPSYPHPHPHPHLYHAAPNPLDDSLSPFLCFVAASSLFGDNVSCRLVRFITASLHRSNLH